MGQMDGDGEDQWSESWLWELEAGEARMGRTGLSSGAELTWLTVEAEETQL